MLTGTKVFQIICYCYWCTTYNILTKYHEFSENFTYMKNNQLAYFQIAAWEN